jgi:hypothetical protein
MTTTDDRPREVRIQARRHADAAREAAEEKRRAAGDGLAGWVAERAGEWSLDGQDEAAMQRHFPLAISLPWGIAPAALPQLPLPAKIRTRFMPAVELDTDPDRAEDGDYVDHVYDEVQASIQRGMDALARKPALPLFG